jgi:hypothetical protein
MGGDGNIIDDEWGEFSGKACLMTPEDHVFSFFWLNMRLGSHCRIDWGKNTLGHTLIRAHCPFLSHWSATTQLSMVFVFFRKIYMNPPD